MELHSIIDILKTGPDTTGLKLGDLLRVKVLAVEEGIGRALVEIGRLRASAELRFPVTAGDEFWVKVTEAGSRLRLQLVRTPAGRPPELAPPLREGLPDGGAGAGRGGAAAPPSDAEPRPVRAFDALPVLPFLMPGQEGRPAAMLKVAWRRGRSADPGEGHRVSLLLALDRLGAVRCSRPEGGSGGPLRRSRLPGRRIAGVDRPIRARGGASGRGRQGGSARMKPDPPKKAVALRYDPAREEAPRVVASGRGTTAENIIAAARACGVPLHADPALAETL
nr:EscU/YscU/HrcU family type III secretion system export apparatus switch protein [Desulfobacterales bacterium]